MSDQLDLFTGEPVEPGEAQSRRSRPGRNGAERANGFGEHLDALSAKVGCLELRIEHIETVLTELRDLIRDQRTIKESYTTKEIADILGRKPYTVREWCRLQRVRAFKAMCGRGCEEEWRIT